MADPGFPVNDLISDPVDIPGLTTPDDPESLSAASAASLAAAAGPRPLMDPPAPGVVTLLGGWRDPNGALHTDALVREMKGRDEERMSRIDPYTNPVTYYNTLMELGVESIGGYPVTPEMISSLLVGDKELLLLGIRIATYGSEKEAVVVCPSCNHEMHVTFELDKDIPTKAMPTAGKFDYDLTLPSGSTAKVTLPVVAVQDEILENRAKLSDGEKRSVLLERCLISIDARPVNKATVQDLGMRDRSFLTEWFSENQPGPDYEGVGLDCEKCDEHVPVYLDLADFFR